MATEKSEAYKASKRAVSKRQVERLKAEGLYDERVRKTNLKSWHKMSVETYDAQEEAQEGVCAICGLPDPSGKRLAVDHDHACCPPQKSCPQCWRGLLCGKCNRALGLFNDDVEVMANAIAYIAKGGTWLR